MTRLTLRHRLVLSIAALLAVVTVVIGIVSVIALNGLLMDRLDAQLSSATNRSQGAYDKPVRDGDDINAKPPPEEFLALSGQPEGTLGAIIGSRTVFSPGVLDSDGSVIPIRSGKLTSLLAIPKNGTPMTIDLGENLGQYRVIVQPSVTGGDALAIGLPLRDVQDTVARLAIVIAGIGLAGVAGAVVAGVLIVRRALRPLERVAATATRVSELPLDRGDVALAVRVPDVDADPATEVGAVGSALNRMLEHVASALESRQASENRVRAFVADASHELRTPLASIRGYSELTRRGNHTLPDDVVHAMGRIESESVRMTSLVEDLLLLARLDEGNRIDAIEVDLGQLVVDALGDAAVAGPTHQWSVQIPDEVVLIHADPSRLHQVIANLLTNARTHTPAGTLVSARVGAVGNEITIEVRDNGPGIDETLVPIIFERFVRGDSSRSRARGSTGLGLAIVSAVVGAHGGRVEVHSVPGDTMFRIILPAIVH